MTTIPVFATGILKDQSKVIKTEVKSRQKSIDLARQVTKHSETTIQSRVE